MFRQRLRIFGIFFRAARCGTDTTGTPEWSSLCRPPCPRRQKRPCSSPSGPRPPSAVPQREGPPREQSFSDAAAWDCPVGIFGETTAPRRSCRGRQSDCRRSDSGNGPCAKSTAPASGSPAFAPAAVRKTGFDPDGQVSARSSATAPPAPRRSAKAASSDSVWFSHFLCSEKGVGNGFDYFLYSCGNPRVG